MFITAGTFNIVLQQASLFEIDEAEVFSVLGIDSSLFEKTTNKVDSSIVGQYLEYIASQRHNTQCVSKLPYPERCIQKIISLRSGSQYDMSI